MTQSDLDGLNDFPADTIANYENSSEHYISNTLYRKGATLQEKEFGETNEPVSRQFELLARNERTEVASKDEKNAEARTHQKGTSSSVTDKRIPKPMSFLAKKNEGRRRKSIYMGSTSERKCIVPTSSNP